MANNQYGAYHLADNPELYDVVRDNNFSFIVTDIDGLINVSSGQEISNAQKTLEFSVVSASIPMFKQEPITIRRGNSVVKLAGAPSFDDGKIIVNDYIGADTKSVLMSWQNLSYDVKNETIGRASSYKKTCYLIEYTPDYKQVRTWKLYGCWVAGLDEGEFNSENSGKKTITATISFDKAVMELPEEE